MKSRFYLYFFILLFLAGSTLLALYLWRENTRTKLTAAEQNLLDEIEELTLVGDYSFPPLSFTDHKGQFKGYEADLVAAMEHYLDIPVNYTQMIWEDALEALSSGEATAITGMRVTGERAQLYNFSNPYWQTAYSFIFPLGSNVDDLLELENPVVVIQQRSATYDYFLEYYYHEEINFVYINRPSDAIEMILEDQADLWFENYQVARYETLSAGIIELVSFHVVEESVGQYAIALGPGFENLVPIINKTLLYLEQERILTDLDRKWFGLANIRPEPSPWDLTLPIVLYGLFTFLIAIFLWNRSLHLKVEEKTNELSSSEKKYKASFESSHDAILITNKEGKIIDCNKNALEIFGYSSKEELLKCKPADIFPYKQPDGSDSKLFYSNKISILLETGISLRFEWAYRRKNGQLFQSEVALISFTLGEEIMFQQNICDITERVQVQERLEYLSLHDQLTGLYNRAFFESELQRLGNSQYYPLTLISCDIDSLKLINDSFGHQAGDQQLVECAEILKDSLRNSDSLARVGGDEFCAIMPNTNQESGEKITERIRLNIERYNDGDPLVPMAVSIGLATTEDPVSTADELIRKADELMYRNKVYRSSTSKNKVLEKLINILDQKDNYCDGHIARMEHYCLKLGKAVKLNEKQMADLLLLVKLHDLGKVTISDQILNKPGRLDDQEWDLIKQHSEKGFRIARSSPEISTVADLILKHHEYWNGSGYPLGLEGEEIPIVCRVFAIVDAYDSMTNHRPYAAVKSREEALEELKETAGKRYDPNLVEEFIALIKRN